MYVVGKPVNVCANHTRRPLMELEDLRAASTAEALQASLTSKRDELSGAAMAHHGGEGASIRTAEHNGHEIVIRTTYEVSVDGQPFHAHFNVDNSGRVQYHGLPTRDFPSLVDLVKKAIDQFPDSFGSAGSQDNKGSDHRQHHGEGH